MGKVIDNKEKIILVKISYTEQTYNILRKTSSIKVSRIFIHEDLILEDQVELRKEAQEVKEARKEGERALIRNKKVVIRDRNQKDSNK